MQGLPRSISAPPTPIPSSLIPAGILGGVDFLYTGRVERVDTKALHLFLNEGIIPVVPPIGFDGEGKTFRVNSDGIAVEVAEAMRAMKVIFLSSAENLCLTGSKSASSPSPRPRTS